MKTINIENLINGVATFNADHYCIENEEMAEEIMAEVESNGAVIVTDEDEREDALAKLDLSEDSNRIIYQAGGCLFSMDDDDNSAMEHKVEDVELDKHNNQGDYLSWVIDGVPQWCQGEFFVDKDGILHHTAIAPNGDEVEITIPYFS